MAISDQSLEPPAAISVPARLTSSVRARQALLFSLFAAVVAGWVVLQGFPTERLVVIAIVVAGLATLVIPVNPAGVKGLLRDWAPLAAVMAGYQLSRGIADTVGMPVQASSVANIDKLIGFGEVPTVWLQAQYLDRVDPAWWELAITIVYTSHFVVVFVIAGVLWFTNRALWSGWVARLVTLSAAGVLTFVLLPTAPPWLASDVGLVGEVERTIYDPLSLVGLDMADHMIDAGRTTTNYVAAMPSLHAGYAALVFAFFAPMLSRRGRWLLALYPVAMGFAQVLTREHWVIDVLIAWLYVAAVMAFWRRIDAVDEDAEGLAVAENKATAEPAQL
jgi:hypothetical protein